MTSVEYLALFQTTLAPVEGEQTRDKGSTTPSFNNANDEEGDT